MDGEALHIFGISQSHNLFLTPGIEQDKGRKTGCFQNLQWRKVLGLTVGGLKLG
jgi:hypothetical protein